MSGTGLVVVLSLGAAAGFALSTNLKHASAAHMPAMARLSPSGIGRFVARMIAHLLWLLGALADVVGLGLQVVALHLGAIAVVQPLLVTGLIFSLILRDIQAMRPRRSDLVWAGVLAAALIGFLFVAGTASGTHQVHTADRLPAIVAAAADRAVHGMGALLGSWPVYAVVVVGALGVLLCQLAYQAGPLTASQPTITAVDPLASVAIGVLIFDEHLRRGPWTGAALIALVALLGLSVVQLGRSQAQAQPALSPAEPA
jgi:hypothetical protein